MKLQCLNLKIKFKTLQMGKNRPKSYNNKIKTFLFLKKYSIFYVSDYQAINVYFLK